MEEVRTAIVYPTASVESSEVWDITRNIAITCFERFVNSLLFCYDMHDKSIVPLNNMSEPKELKSDDPSMDSLLSLNAVRYKEGTAREFLTAFVAYLAPRKNIHLKISVEQAINLAGDSADVVLTPKQKEAILDLSGSTSDAGNFGMLLGTFLVQISNSVSRKVSEVKPDQSVRGFVNKLPK